jgi:hypothetical protein
MAVAPGRGAPGGMMRRWAGMGQPGIDILPRMMTPSTRRHGAGGRKHAASGAARHQVSDAVEPAVREARPRSSRGRVLPGWLRVRPSRRTLVIGGAACGLVVLAAALIVYASSRPSVRVPSLVGATRTAAEARAKALGLALDVKGTEFSAAVPKGAIASQEPTAGVMVGLGSTLTVLVSAGSETFAMPDVIGMMLADARTALRAKGLDVQFLVAASDAATGTVTASAPPPGADVSGGDVVRLTIAAGGVPATSTDLSSSSFVIDPAPPATAGPPDVAFDVATRLADLLRVAGASVVLTREVSGGVGTPTEAARVAAARESSATVLVGFSVASIGLEGLQVLVMPRAGVSAPVSAASGPLGDAVFASLRADHATVSTLTATTDAVLTGSGLAGVRIRLGSSASPADLRLFADPAWADSIARAVNRGLAGLYGRAS